MSAIEMPSGLLGHVEQLERHQQPFGPGARTPGRPLAQAHGGKGRLDNIGGAQVFPMFGGEVVIRRSQLVTSDWTALGYLA
jgi:hypothetical protein